MDWKVLVGVLLLVVYVSVSNTNETRATLAHIKNGLTLAKELGDLIVAKDFTNVIGKLATAVTPFLGIVGPFVSFIAGFSETAELKAIKRLYTEVDNRFDKVDLQFGKVHRLIDWSKIQTQYSDIEQRINAINRLFENIYTFSTVAVKTTTSSFVKSYESDYQNSGAKLYDGIVNERRLFGDGLFTAVVKYSEYDRKRGQTFMLGLLQLLMKAAKLELTYHQLKNHTAALHDYQNQWETRLTNIRKKMMSIDSSIVRQYHTQSGIDIDNYLIQHPKSKVNNNDFNNGLYAMLKEKYPWRDWFTVTYKDIKGRTVHWVGVCGGHIKFRAHGRNVVVASVDERKAPINMAQAQTVVDNVDSCYLQWGYGSSFNTPTDADKAYNSFPAAVRDHCDPYSAQGVIYHGLYNGYDVHFKAAPNRFKLRSQKGCHFVYVFG